MRLYLAGPMRGLDLWNFPAFDAAAAVLRAKGYDVISPAELDRDIGFDEHVTVLPDGFMGETLTRDFHAIKDGADAIVLLAGWQASTGAVYELALGRALGLSIYELFKGRLIPLRQAVLRVGC